MILTIFSVQTILKAQDNSSRFPFQKKGKWGFTDSTGRVVIKAKYQQVFPFFHQYARVKKKDKYGLIDEYGKEKIPIRYDSIGPAIINDRIFAIEDGLWGLLTGLGEIQIPFKYDSIAGGYYENILEVKQGKKIGFVDLTGSEILSSDITVLPDHRSHPRMEDLQVQYEKNRTCADEQGISKETAILIATRQGMYEDISSIALPKIRITTYKDRCAWFISTVKSYTTREGDCRYTNGCTVVLTLMMWIDKAKGEILGRDEVRKLYPNYE